MGEIKNVFIKNISELHERFDVRYHITKKCAIKNGIAIDKLYEELVRDPNCYGFEYAETGIPIIRISDMKQPFIDFTHVARISERIHKEYSKTQLQKYDILISVRGVSAGKVSIFLGEEEKANISPNIIILRLRDKSLAFYTAMILISSIGQAQIRKYISGGGKNSLTAQMIKRIKIPMFQEEVREKINQIFLETIVKRSETTKIIEQIEETFNKHFERYKISKSLTNIVSIEKLGDRWDPHFHNKCYYSLRDFLKDDRFEKVSINKIAKLNQNLLDIKTLNCKIEYIEIGSVNNVSGIIDDSTIDYPKNLPQNPKIKLMDKDILIAKVRPYLISNTIFWGRNQEIISTTNKSAFSCYSIESFEYPFYIAAFLRYFIGFEQIVMYQGGTSYPTVSDSDVLNLKIVLLSDEDMKYINEQYSKYIKNMYDEYELKDDILRLIENR